MKNKSFISCIVVSVLIINHSVAQLQLPSSIRSKAEKSVTDKANTGIDKTLEGNSAPGNSAVTTSSDTNQEPQKKSSYKSKFDFVPGDKLLYYDDFTQAEIGNVPDDWEIQGSAEFVTVEEFPGTWLMISQRTAVIPQQFNELPENFTIQFDLLCTDPFAWGSNQIYFAIGQTDLNKDLTGLDDHLGFANNSVLWLSFHPGSQAATSNTGYGDYKLRTKQGVTNGTFASTAFLDQGEARLVKVSIWRQKKRVRVYVNENKVLDLPSLLPEDYKPNTLVWSAYSYYNDDKYFISNIRVAGGSPDTRKNMLESGRFVTSGILFDVNSDVIKPESIGILKEIGAVLKDNPDVKVSIIGHTDSDGDESKNLALSKKRAEAVKKMLSSDFGIASDRMKTDGKGESEPAVANDSAKNKAINRRVEFVVVR